MDSATYSASSRLQAAGLRPAITLFEEAARTVPLPRAPQPIAIADYGAANGYNSLLPIGAAIAIVRERTRPDHAILVAHTDVAENDFTALFRTLDEDPDSYLEEGCRDLRLGRRPKLLRPDPALAQHRAGLEFVGGALAEPDSDAHPRPRADLLQLG